MDGNDLRWTERREPGQAAADEARTPWEVDYARVIHSASFRRLTDTYLLRTYERLFAPRMGSIFDRI